MLKISRMIRYTVIKVIWVSAIFVAVFCIFLCITKINTAFVFSSIITVICFISMVVNSPKINHLLDTKYITLFIMLGHVGPIYIYLISDKFGIGGGASSLFMIPFIIWSFICYYIALWKMKWCLSRVPYNKTNND